MFCIGCTAAIAGYKQLIALRKKYNAFRLTTAKEVEECITFTENTDLAVMAYQIKKNDENLYVIINGNEKEVEMKLPECNKGWKIVFETGESKVVEDGVKCDGFACTILSDEGK